MRAYQGRDQLKADFLAQITAHEQADALIKGSYAEIDSVGLQGFTGCAIGCAVHSLNIIQGKPANDGEFADHERVSEELGIPLWLAYLQDNLFERLPEKLSQTWPRRLAEAIPVGVAIDDTVLAQILVWSLTTERFGVLHATDDAEVKGWVTTIADAITADANGTITADQRKTAARAARAAWDAWAALDAWDARAARAAWAAWDARAAWAAWDARDARDAGAAETRDAFYPALSEYVLSVLRDLPVDNQQQP